MFSVSDHGSHAARLLLRPVSSLLHLTDPEFMPRERHPFAMAVRTMVSSFPVTKEALDACNLQWGICLMPFVVHADK